MFLGKNRLGNNAVILYVAFGTQVIFTISAYHLRCCSFLWGSIEQHTVQHCFSPSSKLNTTLAEAIQQVHPRCFTDFKQANSFKPHLVWRQHYPLVGLRDDYNPVDMCYDRDTGHVVRDDPLHLYHMPEFDSEDGPGTVAIFKHAYVGTSRFLVFDCHVLWMQGGCDATRQRDSVIRNVYPYAFDNAVVYNGTVVLLAQVWGQAFYHFLVEDFPRIAYVLKFLLDNPDVKLLAFKPTSGQGDLLFDLLGISPSRVIPPPKKLVVETLLVPSATACGQMQGPAGRYISSQLRTAFVERFPDTLKKGSIVLHRRHGSREITNHGELFEALKESFPDRNVLIFDSDGMETAIRMHLSADLVIGPHGAGMSNLLFVEPGTGVIEIHPVVGNGPKPPHYVNYCHTITCIRLGLRCRGMISSHETFSVPVAQVVSIAKELLTSTDQIVDTHDQLPSSQGISLRGTEKKRGRNPEDVL